MPEARSISWHPDRRWRYLDPPVGLCAGLSRFLPASVFTETKSFYRHPLSNTGLFPMQPQKVTKPVVQVFLAKRRLFTSGILKVAVRFGGKVSSLLETEEKEKLCEDKPKPSAGEWKSVSVQRTNRTKPGSDLFAKKLCGHITSEKQLKEKESQYRKSSPVLWIIKPIRVFFQMMSPEKVKIEAFHSWIKIYDQSFCDMMRHLNGNRIKTHFLFECQHMVRGNLSVWRHWEWRWTHVGRPSTALRLLMQRVRERELHQPLSHTGSNTQRGKEKCGEWWVSLIIKKTFLMLLMLGSTLQCGSFLHALYNVLDYSKLINAW